LEIPHQVIRSALATLWPALAAVSLAVAVGREDVTALGLVLLACGTTAGYVLDRLIDERGIDPPSTRRRLKLLFVVTSAIALLIAFTAEWRFFVCCVLGVLAGGYVPLKRWIPKNMLTVPAWTIACCALPFATSPAGDGKYAASAMAVAFIMLANTVLCDVPTVAADRRAGVRSFTTRFGAKAGAAFAGFAACLGVAGGAAYHHWGLAATAAALVPLAFLLGRDPANAWARRWVDNAVVLLPGPVTLLTQLLLPDFTSP
jgi:4-hydroxybenzoate polyprenyltransferase